MCDCGWEIVAARPQAKQGEPVFETTFESHMKGTPSPGGHTGCHTLYGRAKTDRLFEQENDADKKVFAPGCSKIYSAKVKLPTGTTRQGDREWGNEKLSSFWPDDMCLVCITTAIKFAWKFYKGAMGDIKHKGQQEEIKRVVGIAAWCGKVNIKKGAESFRIWVGSPEEGTTGSKIYSAYPKIGARFF